MSIVCYQEVFEAKGKCTQRGIYIKDEFGLTTVFKVWEIAFFPYVPMRFLRWTFVSKMRGNALKQMQASRSNISASETPRMLAPKRTLVSREMHTSSNARGATC